MTNDNPIPDEEPTGNKTRLNQAVSDTNFPELGIIASGALLGLVANALVITSVVSGTLGELSGGLATLAPSVAVAAALFHRYTPTDRDILAPALLFVTLLIANVATLSLRVFQTLGSQSSPLLSIALISVVAVTFTPGPFLGAYIARRWWI